MKNHSQKINSNNISNSLSSIKKNNNKSFFLLLATVLMGSLSLTACERNQSDNQQQSASPPQAEEIQIEENILLPETVVAETAGTQGQPVRYEIATWSDTSTDPIKLADLPAIQHIFGQVKSSDEKSLDYTNNPATKYRFMDNDKPYLDVIDSPKYLEVGWYYANPDDSDDEKSTSQAHAKKAYQFSRQLMGDEGGKVVVDMLGGQSVKNKTINDNKIELAKCEFYSCVLIISKPDVDTDG